MTGQFSAFIGTQCDGLGVGIYHFILDEDAWTLSAPSLAAELERPTWLLRAPTRPVLYAVSELGNRDARIGSLVSFGIDEGGSTLSRLNTVASGGGGPTHLDITPDGRALFAANFGGGQAVCVPLDSDGYIIDALSLVQERGNGPHRRQKSSHPHGVTLDPSGRFLLVPDMGADKILVHPFDADGVRIVDEGSKAIACPAGSGPRLTLFGKDGRYVYLLTELSAEILVFEWNGNDAGLTLVQSLALDEEDAEGDPSAAALVMSGDGKFLYVSNRRTHEMQAYGINVSDGRLSLVQKISCGGEKPWSAQISPSGKSLLVTNQATNNICVFKRDLETGALEFVQQATVTVEAPTCVEFAGS